MRVVIVVAALGAGFGCRTKPVAAPQTAERTPATLFADACEGCHAEASADGERPRISFDQLDPVMSRRALAQLVEHQMPPPDEEVLSDADLHLLGGFFCARTGRTADECAWLLGDATEPPTLTGGAFVMASRDIAQASGVKDINSSGRDLSELYAAGWSPRVELEASLLEHARRGTSFQNLDATYVFLAAMLANVSCAGVPDQDTCISRHVDLLLIDYTKSSAP